jgi:hypothetical protein
MMIKLAFIVSMVITLSGCSTLKTTHLENSMLEKWLHEPCLPALTSLDKLALQSAGTLLGNRVSGLPWLRHNRLITHDISIQHIPGHVSELLNRMSSLAQNGLKFELATVPKHQKEQWQLRYKIIDPLDSFVAKCSRRLVAIQLESPSKALSSLKAIVPDNDYSTLARVAGLYPLASIPFRLGVIKEQHQLTKDWGRIDGKKWFAYRASSTLNKSLPSMSRDILSRHAPLWFIDSRTSANLPGAPYWKENQLKVNTERPEVYSFISKSRWKEQPVTQLNYVIWFTERPKLKRLDWVAGKHDAVVFRVNLDPQGEVIAYDSIHLCGCWYRLFVPENWPIKRSKRYWDEPISIQTVNFPSRSTPRMAVFLQADTHQILYLQSVNDLASKQPSLMRSISGSYHLEPFSHLLELPTASGVRPVFDKKGYITNSVRPERWLFWPMGVKNPGALRRFGDHAMSFIGRRYFDDPNLLSHFSLTPSDDNPRGNHNNNTN